MQRPEIKALIFDMDGVLVDSEPYHLLAYQELLKEFGLKYSEDENKEFLGRTDLAIARILLERHQLKSTPEAIVSGKEAVVTRLLNEHAKAQPGVLDLMERAHKVGIPMAIASSAVMNTIRLVVDTLKIAPYLQNLTSGEEVEHGKPAPDVFLLAARRLGVHPDNCLVIEDSYNGVLAAKAAGMTCVAVPCNTTRHQDHSDADLVLNSLEECDLLGWIHHDALLNQRVPGSRN